MVNKEEEYTVVTEAGNFGELGIELDRPSAKLAEISKEEEENEK